MNTKHYLSTILIFSVIVLSVFLGNAQNCSETIRMIPKGFGYVYYQDNVMLNFTQVMQAASSHKEAFKLLEKSKNMRNISYVFATAGSGCLGFSLGYLIGIAISNNKVNQPLFFSALGAGVAFIGVSIGLEFGAVNKTKEAIDIFNNAIKQKINANLDLGFSPGGVMLRLNF